MFDFFQNIFSAVISVMASMIIAIGLVSVPEIPEQLSRVEQIKAGVIIEKIDANEVQQNNEKEKLPETTMVSEQDKIQLTQIEDNISNLGNKITSLDRGVTKLLDEYHPKIDQEIAQYIDVINSYQSKYENEMQETHKKLLNEVSSCHEALSLIVDTQKLVRNGLTTRSAEFQLSFGGIHIFYLSSLHEMDIPKKIRDWRQELNKYYSQLNNSSVFGSDMLMTKIQNLLSQLKSVETKTVDDGEYKVSIPDSQLLVSKMNSLIQEEEEKWIVERKCQF